MYISGNAEYRLAVGTEAYKGGHFSLSKRGTHTPCHVSELIVAVAFGTDTMLEN